MANTRRHRRGLSTVIGAVFMILVTVGALNVVLWTLQQQNRVAESIIEKSNSNLNKLNEDIEISNVRVANPTDSTMEVSRIVVNMYSSKSTGGGGTEMINGPCTGDFTAIYPSGASEWSCPHSNMIEWKDVTTPETLLAKEAKSFMIKIKPDDLTDQEPAFTMTVSVFTNMGQFTKAGYASGMYSDIMSLGNVYLTDTTTVGDAVDNAHIFGHKLGIASGQSVTLNVAMADFDGSTSTKINSGAKLIINVPKDFTNIQVVSSNGFTNPVPVNEVAEDTYQIVATLNEDLGNVSTEAKVLSFTVTAPVVTEKKIYVMYALVDGEAGNGSISNFSAGALAEIVLQVIPT